MDTFAVKPNVVALGATVLALLLAGVVLVSPGGRELAMPGDLSSPHGPLSNRCEACHPSGAESIKGVWHGLEANQQARAQTALCLECHTPGDEPLAAHGFSPSREYDLAAARERGVPGAGADRFECAMCHHEHAGRDASVARIDSARCQACHADTMSSFASGHPELEGYGTGEATIVFDHANHIERHFDGAADAPTSCTDCHVADASGTRMDVRPFEESCASCHDLDVRGEGRSDGRGLAFLALPGIDTWSLDDAGLGLGTWPADSGVVETEVGPFLALLLGDALDPAVAEIALDASEAGTDELERLASLAWETKRLFDRLQNGGHEALLEKVATGLGVELDPATRASLVAGLPCELLEAAGATWFPGAAAELEAHDGGASPATVEGELGDTRMDAKREEWVAGGGWYRQESDFSLRYRSRGHADPFLTAWIELTTGATPGTAAHEVRELLVGSDSVGRCEKCHDLETDPIEWAPKPATGGLTRFAHEPHLPTLGETGCLECHTVQHPEATGPGRSPSGIAALSITSCVSCHSTEGASDDCLTCHSYHERTRPTPTPPAPLSIADDLLLEGASL